MWWWLRRRRAGSTGVYLGNGTIIPHHEAPLVPVSRLTQPLSALIHIRFSPCSSVFGNRLVCILLAKLCPPCTFLWETGSTKNCKPVSPPGVPKSSREGTG
jgi:hypothetical protein